MDWKIVKTLLKILLHVLIIEIFTLALIGILGAGHWGRKQIEIWWNEKPKIEQTVKPSSKEPPKVKTKRNQGCKGKQESRKRR